MNASKSASVLQSAPVGDARRFLKVGGIVPFTATDYPGKLAAVIFVQGCPWRCGYCHNPHLQSRPHDEPMHLSDVRALLQRRMGLIDAVVFSGGEPTIEPGLADAIRDVRNMGFCVGLHSAGIYPKRLAAVLPLLDWIGFDAKAPFDHRYDRITGVAGSAAQALASAQSIIDSKVDHEFRTTIHPSLLHEDDIMALATKLSEMGVTNYALQVFRPQGCNSGSLKDTLVAGYPSDSLVRKVSALFSRFTLRTG